MWRWTEVDPFGHTIYCSEETWKRKTVQRSDLAAHEAEVRATVRDPDAIYDDSQSAKTSKLVFMCISVPEWRSSPVQCGIIEYVIQRLDTGLRNGVGCVCGERLLLAGWLEVPLTEDSARNRAAEWLDIEDDF